MIKRKQNKKKKRKNPPLFFDDLKKLIGHEVEIRSQYEWSYFSVVGILIQISENRFELKKSSKKGSNYDFNVYFDRIEIRKIVDLNTPVIEIKIDKRELFKKENGKIYTLCKDFGETEKNFKYLISKTNKEFIVRLDPLFVATYPNVSSRYIYGKLKYNKEQSMFYVQSGDFKIQVRFNIEAVCTLYKDNLPWISIL